MIERKSSTPTPIVISTPSPTMIHFSGQIIRYFISVWRLLQTSPCGVVGVTLTTGGPGERLRGSQ